MKRNRHFRWMAYLLCLSLGALCLGSCQKDFGNDNISDTSLFGGSVGGWEPSVTISGPTDWVSGNSNISLTLNGSYSGTVITWKCPAPDFQIISGQGTANLVCKFSSTQNPVVTVELKSFSSPGIIATTESSIQLKIVHSLHKPGLIDLYYDGVGYDGTECFLIVIKNSIYHDRSIPVNFEIQVNNGTLHHDPGHIYAFFYFKDPGEYIISCRAKFRDIYSDWIEETIYKEDPDPYYR